MDIIRNLFYGFPDLWGGGVAHSVMILALVITLGLSLGKIRVKGVSLGLAWILFIGLIFGHFSLNLDEHLLHFLKEFGLILFVYSIGLEVGPSFFSSFKNGGKSLNLLSIIVVALSIITTLVIYSFSNTSITSMTGILSGAVTNTPGLGAAQQAYSDLRHIDAPSIAAGYAIAYPMGVLGVILSFIVLRYALRINKGEEEAQAKRGFGHLEAMTLNTFSVKITNKMIFGDTVKEVRHILNRDFMISQIHRSEGTSTKEMVNGQTILNEGDIVYVVAHPSVQEPLIALLGEKVEMAWEEFGNELITRRILVTKPGINGKTIAQMQIRSNLGTNITRVNRAGVDLIATPDLKLQLGDRVTVVGTELAISHTEKVLGNQMKRLNYPNLIPIFLGIMLGCIVANIPFFIPGINENLRLGLTGGPLVVAILIGYFGPKYNLVTYNTISANLMLREIGICIFLACVGLGTGEQFIETVATEKGMIWIVYGIAITMIPIILGGIIGRFAFHINYFTLLGVLAGANTNPSALAYVRDQTSADAPTVGYANVYPFAMFLRIVTIQIIIFVFG
jgi:putative transport protein